METIRKPFPQDIIDEIEEASKKPVVPDDDCPELTAEQLLQVAAIARKKREERVKRVVSLRLSPSTIEKAQMLGKGYTGILSRIIENALNNPELLKQCL